MDGHRFDDLTRTLAKRTNRRGFLAGVAGVFGGLSISTADAKCPDGEIVGSGRRCVCKTTGRPPGPNGCACLSGESRCKGTCVDFTSSPTNCGGCDITCGSSTPFCVVGACAACRGDVDCGGATPYCAAGVCVECRSTTDCDDGLACTVEACVAGVCQVTPNHAACDDGFSCTTNTCDPTNPGRDARGCVTSTDDSLCPAPINKCLVNRCLAGQGCVNGDNVGAPCGDPLNRCIHRSECRAGGVCFPVETASCPDDSNPCTTRRCNPASGECEIVYLNNHPCDDGDACTIGDICRDGACVPGESVICPAAKPNCQDGTCTCVGSGLTCPDPDSSLGCCGGGCFPTSFGRFCCAVAGRPCVVDEECCGRTCRTNDDFTRTCA